MITPLTASDVPAFEAGVQHERERICSLIRSRLQELSFAHGSPQLIARKCELERMLLISRELL